MVDKTDPIEKVKEELDSDSQADNNKEAERENAKEAERDHILREQAEKAEREAEQAREHEKEGEELRALDAKVTKLCEDVESWKNQTHSEAEKLREELSQSIHALSEAAAKKPEPVTPQNPPPPLPSSELPPSGEAVHPEAKTAAKTPPAKKRRFL